MINNNPFDAQPPSAPPPPQYGVAAPPPAGATTAAPTPPAPAPGMVAGAMQQAQTYTPATRAVDSRGTVSGQVDSILAKDGPLMERARAIAREQANSKGLINSSMAVQAGQQAMIDSAMPMASQDAQAYNNADSENMGAVNNASQFNAGSKNQFGLQKGEQAFTAGQNELNQKFQQGMQATQIDAQSKAQAQAHAQTLEQMGYQNKLATANVPANFAASTAASTMDRVNAIMADPNLDAAAKKAAVDNVVNYANSTLSWAEKFYSTPLSRLSTPPADSGAQAAQNRAQGLPDTFDAGAYLQLNPDVAAAVASGKTTAVQHWLEFGRNEGRKYSLGAPTAAPAVAAPSAGPGGIIGSALKNVDLQPVYGGIA